jgi:hypothetical protein
VGERDRGSIFGFKGFMVSGQASDGERLGIWECERGRLRVREQEVWLWWGFVIKISFVNWFLMLISYDILKRWRDFEKVKVIFCWNFEKVKDFCWYFEKVKKIFIIEFILLSFSRGSVILSNP